MWFQSAPPPPDSSSQQHFFPLRRRSRSLCALMFTVSFSRSRSRSARFWLCFLARRTMWVKAMNICRGSRETHTHKHRCVFQLIVKLCEETLDYMNERNWCHLLHVDVFFGAGLKHSNSHRLSELHGVLSLHTLPSRVVIFVSDCRRTFLNCASSRGMVLFKDVCCHWIKAVLVPPTDAQ